MFRISWPISLTAVSVVLASLTVIGWHSNVLRNREQAGQRMTTQLIKGGRADEAAIIAGTLAEKAKNPQQRSRWQATEISALTASGDTARLVTLYRNNSAAILQNEEASVLAARSLRFDCRDEKSATAVITAWKNKTHHPEWWFCLKVDTLIAKRERNAAIALLKQNRFPGAADTGRLLRLAILCDLAHPTGMRAAWGYLQQAYQIAPNDPDVRSYRAQMLETFGRTGEARVEYVAAYLAKPQSVYHCDQLAEYYQRQASTAMALQTWGQGLSTCPADFLAVKALFWSRMIVPLSIAAPGTEKTIQHSLEQLPTGNLTRLARFMNDLPHGQFWDDNAFNALPNSPQLLASRRELFYLRLCDALQHHREGVAQQLITDALKNPDVIQTNPTLIRSLAQVLAFRQSGNFSRLTGKTLPPITGEQHPLITQLDAAASQGKPLDAQTASFLRSDEAFTAIFLTTGWWEASLQLRPQGETTPLPANIPDWYVYALTQVLRANRDDKTALAFAEKCPVQLPAEQVLIAEMQNKVGRTDEGNALLVRLARADNDSGMRAAWLLAVANMEDGKLSDAKQIIQAQPRLTRSTIGKELLARIALENGDIMDAERRYMAISSDSLEAQAYLARTAFAQHQWQKAHDLTLQMQEEMPDDMTVRENLRSIDKEIAQQKKGAK